jgi:hypothetical protein
MLDTPLPFKLSYILCVARPIVVASDFASAAAETSMMIPYLSIV